MKSNLSLYSSILFHQYIYIQYIIIKTQNLMVAIWKKKILSKEIPVLIYLVAEKKDLFLLLRYIVLARTKHRLLK